MEPLRFSQLRWMSRSPAHTRYAIDHPAAGDTPAMRLGRISHKLILGATPETDHFVVFDGERRGKAWAEFKEANADQDIVSAAEYEKATAIAAAVAAHPEAQEVLQGERERRLLWKYAGRECRVTPDCFSPTLLTEVKTTGNAAPGHFPYYCLRAMYPGQLAFQLDGIKANGLPVPERVSIVAVETTPPFSVCVFGVTQDALEFGRKVYVGWMEQFLNCERAGIWPSYGMGVLDAPPEAFELVGADGEVLDVSE